MKKKGGSKLLEHWEKEFLDACNHDNSLMFFLFCISQGCHYRIFPRTKRIKHIEDPDTYDKAFEQKSLLNIEQI